MSQSNQLSCQTKFVELLHGKIDTVTLAEFQQLQVQMDSSNDLILLDATSNVGLKKVFNEASKTGTIKDIDAICQVTYNILGEHSNAVRALLLNATLTNVLPHLLFKKKNYWYIYYTVFTCMSHTEVRCVHTQECT